MIIIKSPREIELMKESGKITASLLTYLTNITREGMSTYELDELAGKFIKSHGGIPSTKGYGGFPGNICISVNDCLIHGIPSRKIILKEGDIVTFDVLVTKNGYTTDAARTIGVGKISEEATRLIETSKECFFNAVKLIKAGVRLGDISHTIEMTATNKGYTLTRDYTGHGVGREVHEDPYVPNVGKMNTGLILKKGMTLAIEPMINMGKVETYVDKDNWSVRTKDGKLCSHYENTVVVLDDGYEIITLEEKEKNN